MLFDLPLEQLRTYRPERTEPPDFAAFWERTLAETREHPLNASFAPVDSGLTVLDVYDVTFAGYDGQPIKGWFVTPAGTRGPLPCVVEFIGYGGGRAYSTDWLFWAAAGFAHFIMDTRGQGSSWKPGDTPDCEPNGGNPQYPGFMTRGVLRPETYYYRRVFSDAVRAVEAARSHPVVDGTRVAATGVSQGGGITIAVAGLVPDLAAVMPDVPFLCHYRRATELVDTLPYFEIVQFCRMHREQVDQVFQTLAYFDGVNFATRAKAPALFSTALMDDTCPPSTVFAAYNHYGGEKDIRVWRYNRHEGGESLQARERLQFFRSILGRG